MSAEENKTNKELSAQERDYRNQLLEWEQKIGDSYDKTLITLSGGALGLTITFIKNIIEENAIVCINLLLFSWGAWIVSLTSLLMALYFAQFAYRRTITQLDEKTIYEQTPGGKFTNIVSFCNAVGGIGFIVGVVAIVMFVSTNL